MSSYFHSDPSEVTKRGTKMTKKLQRSLHDYLSKLKTHTPHVLNPSKTITTSTNWILSGCKHPKTPSFAISQKPPQGAEDCAATLSDIDRFLVENFSSLYSEEDLIKKKGDEENGEKAKVFLFESPKFSEAIPDVQSSSRFFISPRKSSSLVEESKSQSQSLSSALASEEGQTVISVTSSTSLKEPVRMSTEIKTVPLVDESIAVLTYSSNPYDDFRGSMEQMIEARLNQHQSIDWDFMEDLLFCYLKLNEKRSYKYILGAFVDLTASLRQSSTDGTTPAAGQNPRRRRKRNGV